MEDFKVTVDDLHRARGVEGSSFCVPGMRAWAANQGLDFRRFIREGGIMASELEATGNAPALALVAALRKERNNE